MCQITHHENTSKKYLYVKTPPGHAPQNEKRRKTLKFQFTFFFSVVVESVHAVCIAECAPTNLKINQTYARVNNSFVLAGIQCHSCSLVVAGFWAALHSFLDLLSQDLDSVENSTIRLCSEN